MNPLTIQVFILICKTFVFIQPINSLDCYKCSSMSDFNCSQPQIDDTLISTCKEERQGEGNMEAMNGSAKYIPVCSTTTYDLTEIIYQKTSVSVINSNRVYTLEKSIPKTQIVRGCGWRLSHENENHCTRKGRHGLSQMHCHCSDNLCNGYEKASLFKPHYILFVLVLLNHFF